MEQIRRGGDTHEVHGSLEERRNQRDANGWIEAAEIAACRRTVNANTRAVLHEHVREQRRVERPRYRNRHLHTRQVSMAATPCASSCERRMGSRIQMQSEGSRKSAENELGQEGKRFHQAGQHKKDGTCFTACGVFRRWTDAAQSGR
jgi:hypothetical protein